MTSKPNDAIQSLMRLTQAASRLTARMTRANRPIDPEQEIDHMQANLDVVRKIVAESA